MDELFEARHGLLVASVALAEFSRNSFEVFALHAAVAVVAPRGVKKKKHHDISSPRSENQTKADVAVSVFVTDQL